MHSRDVDADNIFCVFSPKELPFRETFLPYYYGQHAKAFMTPVDA